MGWALRCLGAGVKTASMKVAVTGATGFVGRHLVAELLKRGHNVTAVGRNAARAAEMPWRNEVRFITCDVHASGSNTASVLGIPEVLIHLAWPGLPNYRELFHFEDNLPADYRFIKQMVN